MNSDRFQLLAPLTPTDCVSRLAGAVDVERSPLLLFRTWFGSRPVVGRVTESSVRLRKRIRYRNSFQSFLTATIQPVPGGTLISAQVGLHPFVRVFMLVWFGAVLLISGAMLIGIVATMISGAATQRRIEWMGVFGPITMLAFGFALVRFGRYLAREEARFLKDFLIEALDAHIQSEPPNNALQPTRAAQPNGKRDAAGTGPRG